MKKLLLTGITAALFSIAAIGQQQQKDTTQNQSSQYRSTEEMKDDADQAADSASTDFQQGVNDAERNAEQAGDNIQREGQELRQDAEQAGDNINRDAQRAGDQIEQGAEKAGDEIEENAEQAGQDIRQGVERTGDEIQQGAQRTGDRIQQGAEEAGDKTNRAMNEMNNDMQSGDRQNQEATANYNTAPELEVVESKEGPNSEVVYKYQDEYFYIDRNEKKIVKAKESDLQDARHEVIVKDPQETNENDAASNKTQSDDQQKDNQK
jgi:gas vesicle protein